MTAGTVLAGSPAILLLSPVCVRVVSACGRYPVQCCVSLLYNVGTCNISPAVGNTLFVAIKGGRSSLSKVMPYMLWYYVAILLGLLLVTYVPVVSLGLPMAAGLL